MAYRGEWKALGKRGKRLLLYGNRSTQIFQRRSGNRQRAQSRRGKYHHEAARKSGADPLQAFVSQFSFPFETKVEEVLGLRIECLKSLDETIDAFFVEYERTGQAELFEGLCPYFGVVWPAGKKLAEIMGREGEAWRGREVLELGCGLAIPSLILARSGAIVTATDLHPDVPVFLELNRARNRVPGPDYLFLDWRVARTLPDAELLIGSDIVYDRHQPEQLHAFLRGNSFWREAVFTDPGRPYWESFRELVKQHPWGAEESLEGGVFVLRLRR
jgi:predicted nicotinamide N-methyase